MRLIMAANLQHAVSVAISDCEWEQTRQDRFIDQDGGEVQYMPDPDVLRGHDEGTIVYVSHEGAPNYYDSAMRYEQWQKKKHILIMAANLQHAVSVAISD